MDPLAAKIIQKVDRLAEPAPAGFLPTIVARMTGLELSQWQNQGKSFYGEEIAEWEKERSLIMAFSQAEAARRVSNLLDVITKANKYANASKEFAIADDNDVFWGMLEHAKTISDDGVQEIIARMIAGEYNAPGTYAMSTLQILKSLGKKDLQRFSFFASFYLPEYGFLRHFFGLGDGEKEVRVKLGVDYSDFLELQSLGLVQSRDYTFPISLKKDEKFELKTCLDTFIVRADKTLKDWDFPRCYKLTTAGEQILKHLDIKPSAEFVRWLRQYLRQEGLEVMDLTDIDH